MCPTCVVTTCIVVTTHDTVSIYCRARQSEEGEEGAEWWQCPLRHADLRSGLNICEAAANPDRFVERRRRAVDCTDDVDVPNPGHFIPKKVVRREPEVARRCPDLPIANTVNNQHNNLSDVLLPGAVAGAAVIGGENAVLIVALIVVPLLASEALKDQELEASVGAEEPTKVGGLVGFGWPQ